jgi:hypothetical protein
VHGCDGYDGYNLIRPAFCPIALLTPMTPAFGLRTLNVSSLLIIPRAHLKTFVVTPFLPIAALSMPFLLLIRIF